MMVGRIYDGLYLCFSMVLDGRLLSMVATLQAAQYIEDETAALKEDDLGGYQPETGSGAFRNMPMVYP